MGPVIDASVAVKWVIDEAFTLQARSLLADTALTRQPVLAPPHLPGEVLNAVYRRMRRTDELALSEDAAMDAVSRFLMVPVRLLTPPRLYERAFELATRFSLATVYDSLYIALAQFEGTEFWTADERLLNSLRGAVPGVRWIADYQTGS